MKCTKFSKIKEKYYEAGKIMRKHQLKLQHLIIGVAILAFFLTITTSIWSSYRMNKQTLINNTLETNRVYAAKIATTANIYLNETLQTLTYNANTISKHLNDEHRLDDEAERLRMQTNSFNSISITNSKGKVLATSPENLNLKGKTITSNAMKNALREQKPMISDPYKAMTNRELIYISAPIFNEKGKFLGVVGGTIYLKKNNILYTLLGNHFYEGGSYVYVVDRKGRIIYDQNHLQINKLVTKNPVVQKIMHSDSDVSGSQRIVNEKGMDILASYATVENTGWGVVSQRTTATSIQPAVKMVKQMIYTALPLLLISLIIIIWLSIKISLPLQKLAELAEKSMRKDEEKNFCTVPAWYYEAIQLKEALIQSFSFLHQQVNFLMDQSTTDPLTELSNRRTLDKRMRELMASKTPFSIVLMDIDYFKSVNDTYGHNMGDKVLKYLAFKLKRISHATDLCCRYGGEEFIILLPNTTGQEAFKMAESLRRELQITTSPTGKAITISAGIAEYPIIEGTPTQLIEYADQCLYQAKEQGRNRVVLANRYQRDV